MDGDCWVVHSGCQSEDAVQIRESAFLRHMSLFQSTDLLDAVERLICGRDWKFVTGRN